MMKGLDGCFAVCIFREIENGKYFIDSSSLGKRS
jgi:hypothetical protein